MKKIKVFLLIILIWNILAVVTACILDKLYPFYSPQRNEYELTEDEIIDACPEALISEADKELLLSVLYDSAVVNRLPIEYGNILYLSDEDCSRIIRQYADAPTDIYRISVSGSPTYVSVEFYQTESDKGYPASAYPCLDLTLEVLKNRDSTLNYSYSKDVYSYSLKVPQHMMVSSVNWGGPDATFRKYSCNISPDGTTFEYQEKILVPVKHEHLYNMYFWWFDALMSV